MRSCRHFNLYDLVKSNAQSVGKMTELHVNTWSIIHNGDRVTVTNNGKPVVLPPGNWEVWLYGPTKVEVYDHRTEKWDGVE